MGLKKWFSQNWVDIGSKKADGTYAKCGRSKLKGGGKIARGCGVVKRKKVTKYPKMKNA